MKSPRKINAGNLRMLCWQRGFKGVAGLARKLRKSRITLHRAVNDPDQFGPTYRQLEEVLLEK